MNESPLRRRASELPGAGANPPLPQILDQPSASHVRTPSEPLLVLTLTPFYPSDNDEVFGCFVAEPLRGLAGIGIENVVYAVQPFYRKPLHATDGGARAYWVRYFSLPGGMGLSTAGAFVFARIVSQVRELHGARKIDLIHAHASLPCGHAAMLLSAELKLPYIVSVHGLDAFSTTQVSGKSGEWCRRISQRVYRNAKRVVCISERVRERVIEGSGGGCRTSVVYNGVNEQLFSPREDPAENFTVLSVGNLIPIKGHDVLLRAIGSLAGEFPRLRLEIIGGGAEQTRLESLAHELGIHDRVSFQGRRNRREVADAMQRCAIFALPSRFEGLGCVYLEAMSAAKPVIGCRGQGIAEIIRHGSNGFLVGPDNEKELALALAMLLRDPGLRHRLGQAARDTILDRLTLTQQAESLARIYRECAG
jgi:teichuronic acid biosynthesis glycosyltransferase TuaC